MSINLHVQVGDRVELEIKDGEDTVTKEFVVVAYTDQPSSLGGGFMLPADTLQSF